MFLHLLAPAWLSCRRRPGTRRAQPFVPTLDVLEARWVPATFTVTNTADSGPGSLRQAILDANASASTPDTINFTINSGVQTIRPTSALPVITDTVVLDGTTQPGYAGTPLIVLRGNDAGDGTNGLVFTANGNTLRGLVINGFRGDGVRLNGARDSVLVNNFIGTDATGTTDQGNAGNGVVLDGARNNTLGGTVQAAGNVLSSVGNLISGNDGNGVLLTNGSTSNFMAGNWVGTDISGLRDLGNRLDGMAILNGSNDNLIAGTFINMNPFIFKNVFSGNDGNGMRVRDSNNTLVHANFHGLGVDNNTPVGNTLSGILVEGTSANTRYGGVIPLGNVSAANGRNGVEIRDSASGTVVFNCFCGLAAFNDVPAVGNLQDGVLITSSGGGTVLRTNVISGNGDDGVEISGAARGVEITEVIIGMNTSGMAPLPNGGNGVEVGGTATQITIGGFQRSVIPRNTISANRGHGIALLGNATGTSIFNTFIGTEVTGAQAFGNGGNGIFIDQGARANTIGGTTSDMRNLISGNTGNGVEIRSNDNRVEGNLIGTTSQGTGNLGNGGNGVLLSGANNNRIGGTQAGAANTIAFSRQDGVQVNGGVGNGILTNAIYENGGLGINLVNNGNSNQPAPLLRSAEASPLGVVVRGTLTAAPNTTYRLEFFSNPFFSTSTAPEGQNFLGFLPVTTNALGQATFAAPLSSADVSGSLITATATASNNDTSEFSSAVRASVPLLVTGVGSGAAPFVNGYNQRTLQLQFSTLAFSDVFTGGVRVASGDITGDGHADLIAAAGPGGGPHVRVFDGRTGLPVPGPAGSFFAFPEGFAGGVFVAAGDVNNDGFADIIAGAGAGGVPVVSVFSGQTGHPLASWFAYAEQFQGGVTVAAGDIDGNGTQDIVTGAGPGGGPHVRAFTRAGQQLTGPLGSYFAYAPTFAGGVFVAAGDVNGDGFADVVTGPGSGLGPDVTVRSGATGALLADFDAFAPIFQGGVRVGTADVTGDGLADLLLAAGPGGGPQLRIVNGVTLAQVDSFFAYDPLFRGGLFTGGVS